LSGIDFPQLLIGFVILIASLTFHEAAHAWTANKLGDPTARMLGRLTLNPAAHIDVIGTIVFPLLAMLTNIPLIGWAKPVPVDMRHLRHPRRDFAVVAAAGPISNLLLAAGGTLVLSLLITDGPGSASGIALSVLETFILLNVLLAVFNMIPIPPLDGGNILIGILPESLAATIDKLRPWGFLLLYGLMLSGMLWTIVSPVHRAVLNVLRLLL
jgi:Zn-dependent protease